MCFSDVLVSCDTIMNNTRGARGLRVVRGAHTGAGARAGTGVILSSDRAENSDWPAQGGGCQLSGSVPSVVSESQ